MTEMQQAMKMMAGGFPTVILKCPTGRYALAGRIPGELTRPQTHGTPQIPPGRVSMIWDTEAEVIAALVAIGVTQFYLSDCSLYQG